MGTTPPSDDLREINLFSGFVFDEQAGVDLMGLLDNREGKVRSVQGDSFLLVPPKLNKGPTPATFELRVTGELDGVTKKDPST